MNKYDNINIKNIGFNMKDNELVKCLISHWTGERLFLFF